MALPKIMGIETEYGISVGSAEADPITTSTLLVTAFASRLRHHISWDFHDESPGRDARGAARLGSLAPMVETHLANAVLTNGARFYVDHAHPEYSSPEVATPLEAVLFDRAGEEVLRQAMVAAAERYPGAPDIVVYKNNSDSKGNSYGCHENFLLSRDVPFAEVISAAVPHLVTRQIYCGAGKVGAETPVFDDIPPFQISQRSEFFEEVVGLETTLKRPIVNTRDEPHADPSLYRRLHVIIGDANMSEVATFLKVGTTALILAMLEDGALTREVIELKNPVRSVRQISADPSLRATVELVDGRRVTAADIQQILFESAVRYVESGGGVALGDVDQANEVVKRWGSTLDKLATDPDSLAGQVDWIAKKRIIDAYADRHGLAPGDPKLRAMDLQYHDLRPERSLSARLGLETLVGRDDVARAVTEPPRSTRAWFRGSCLAKFPDEVATANWDSLVFDLGTDPLRRVPMMDPLRGTAAMTEDLLDEVGSAHELLARLDA
ncbi:MAG: depupylase/deamidase Dop [Actinomycetes bacterium]